MLLLFVDTSDVEQISLELYYCYQFIIVIIHLDCLLNCWFLNTAITNVVMPIMLCSLIAVIIICFVRNKIARELETENTILVS